MSQPALFDLDESFWKRKRCVVCGQALCVQHDYTYVVQRQVWIKIGATNMPRRRINELSREAWQQHIIWPRGMDWTKPVYVHAVLEGDIEHEIHARFSEYHVVGEWFQDTLAIRQWLREVT